MDEPRTNQLEQMYNFGSLRGKSCSFTQASLKTNLLKLGFVFVSGILK